MDGPAAMAQTVGVMALRMYHSAVDSVLMVVLATASRPSAEAEAERASSWVYFLLIPITLAFRSVATTTHRIR